MKDAKGNKVGIGTLLYANLGEYGPCVQICGFEKDPFGLGYDCVYLQWGMTITDDFGNQTFLPNFENPKPCSLESLEKSYWSATRTWWQELKQPFRKWWYSFRYELKKALASYKD